MKTGIFLQKCYNSYFQNLWSSQFIRLSTEELVKLNRYEYIVTARKKVSTHFLYLFLLTQEIPMVQKWTLKTTGIKGIIIRSNVRKHHY
jgi:hypothetical protein